ncbi:hypothetical protein [Kribbella sp. NPDC004875]|uniref:hypothetical protein n=1 Tax=Kribbella sp. NPDC004875 TaxID=3364107 RepID=UPI0036AA74A7
MVVVVMLLVLLTGCQGPEQQLRQAAAQSAREAASEVGTTRLAVEQLRSRRLWSQSAEQIVKDAEQGVEKAASSFSAQQPATGASTSLYEQVTKALDDAQTAVTAVRIALGNNDLAAAERQLDQLRAASRDLQSIEEVAS